MRITARLIETATGAVAAGSKADGAVSDVFSLQDRIAKLGTVLLARTSGTLRRDAALLGYRNGDGDVGGNRHVAFSGVPWTEPETSSFASGESSSRRGPDRLTGLLPGVGRGGPAAEASRPRVVPRLPTRPAAWSWGLHPNRPANGRRSLDSPPVPALKIPAPKPPAPETRPQAST